MRPHNKSVLIAAACAALAASSALAAPAASELTDLSLEQLSNVVVTSVSRQEEKLAHAAASIYIISASDIRRSGAQSIPEALRLAPNLQVARVDARNYAITARGFNSPFENKLLVLIDGRSVYSPLFSGVFWDAQDLVLDDIERIEVISGPGSTIWGANAVNGVINVITKSAKDVPGGRAALIAGADERAGTMRYGAALGAHANYRLYAKYRQNDDTENAAGASTHTGYQRRQAGFRADWDLEGGGATLSGDAYQGSLHQAGTRDIGIAGANLNASLTGHGGEASDYRLQVLFDHTERNQPTAFVEYLDTIDVQAQYNLQAGRHRMSAGAGYRGAQDRIENGAGFAFLPDHLQLHTGNLFAQDEIALTDALRFTAGLKVEHNNYTGAELLPNLRLGWSPAEAALLWTSLSRTVRAPSRIDHDFYSPAVAPIVNGVPRYTIAGGPDFISETANVLELGYRAQPSAQFSYSATAFYADYDRLRTLEPLAGGGVAFRNFGEGRVRGIELWGRWHPSATLHLSAGLVQQSIRTGLSEGSRDSSGTTGLTTNDPGRHWLLRASKDLSDTSQLDVSLRYAGSLPKPAVPAYYEMDARWSWALRPDTELSLIGQNLLHRSHVEFGAAPARSVFERSVLLKLTQRF
ncbi:TonB-dependent receptor [Massilia sp. R2A-15]|uniref:TonB-dependent receptor plug domain-containing protein n=1 Tax=Massilia sp. R2A-15 TaxID=3064278 RepID=UPI0027325B1D|nr:TonB-dependent receptor [Massilia sp. R2A-15]WLI91347.1 TonB-dependent receptor [Massilia sp. R2A-15]